MPEAGRARPEEGLGKIAELVGEARADLASHDYQLAANLLRALLHEGGDSTSEMVRSEAGAALLLGELRRITERLDALLKAWS